MHRKEGLHWRYKTIADVLDDFREGCGPYPDYPAQANHNEMFRFYDRLGKEFGYRTLWYKALSKNSRKKVRGTNER